jgi:hypothetical protein
VCVRVCACVCLCFEEGGGGDLGAVAAPGGQTKRIPCMTPKNTRNMGLNTFSRANCFCARPFRSSLYFLNAPRMLARMPASNANLRAGEAAPSGPSSPPNLNFCGVPRAVFLGVPPPPPLCRRLFVARDGVAMGRPRSNGEGVREDGWVELGSGGGVVAQAAAPF